MKSEKVILVIEPVNKIFKKKRNAPHHLCNYP